MRRIFVALLSCSLSAGAAVGACGFPDVSYGTGADTNGGTVDGTLADTGTTTDSGAASDASARKEAGEILIDGSSPDALIVQDAGQKFDASGCQAADCDCDHDGYKNSLKAGCGGTSPDCDDRDSRTHPDQGFLLEKGDFPQQGDWDCNGTVERLYKTSVTCAGLNLGLGCADIFGFEDAPACGEPGSFIRCERASLLSLSCTVASRESRTQPCR